MDLKQQVYETLGNWIIETTSGKRQATPEAIAALPKVAEVFMQYELSHTQATDKVTLAPGAAICLEHSLTD